MKDYYGFTHNQRMQSLKKTKQAIIEGTIPPATTCEICKLTEGNIAYHNENYIHPTKYLHSLCVECHMRLHMRFNNPTQWKQHVLKIKQGWQPRPWTSNHEFFKNHKYAKYKTLETRRLELEGPEWWYHLPMENEPLPVIEEPEGLLRYV